MGKKIGILTFHRGFSYGGPLQAYALQNFLLKNGIDNEIVDYSCEFMVNHYQKVFRKIRGIKLKARIWGLLMARDIIKSRKTYPVFTEKYLKLSCPYNADTVKNAKDKYRKFIAGSDQIWSPTCVGFDPVYFLNFADPKQKYSYAASIATDKIPVDLEEEYKKRLSDFQRLSLREISGKRIIENIVEKKAQVNIDPTFLLEKEDWDNLAQERQEKEPYIFVFTVLQPRKLLDYALKLSEKTGYRVIYLNNQTPKKRKGVTYLDPVMPNEFVTLIKNAEYVCTNSFHGMAFSMIYEKKFVAEPNTAKGNNIRSRDFLESVGLSDRILEDNIPDIDEKIDYEKIRNYIEKEREISRNYLLSIC